MSIVESVLIVLKILRWMKFIIGGAIGMLLANKIKKKLDDKVLQTIFAVMLVVLGVFIYFSN